MIIPGDRSLPELAEQQGRIASMEQLVENLLKVQAIVEWAGLLPGQAVYEQRKTG